MGNIIKKVIMASAGTGKTYRLSLEFIALLLKYKDYPEFNFDQIVVMTFTRKATAEIREKIIDFLQELASQGEESTQIITNLEKVSGYQWVESDLDYIKKRLLPEILQRKDLLQVSTIDSFITNIFKSMIAPFLRIKEFSIDNRSNEELMPQLLEFLFSDSAFPHFEPLLKRLNIRTIESSEGFINSLLDNRWILEQHEYGLMSGELSRILTVGVAKFAEYQAEVWYEFKSSYLSLVEEYNSEVFEVSNKLWNQVISVDYQRISHFDSSADVKIEDFFSKLLSQPDYVCKHFKVFIKRPFPFSKTTTKNLKGKIQSLESRFATLMTKLADYYLISEILPKQSEIISAWKLLCNQYDKLKFSLGKFTYNDITFYTNKYLYKESLSLIDRERGVVSNIFYEQLVSRFRFILIDEFQDTSFNQYSILLPIIKELLSGEGSKDYSGVIVVGDPKQSIYGWRGGERGILNHLPSILNVEAEELDQCFRSTKPVIDIINRVFTDEDFQTQCDNEIDGWKYAAVKAKNWDQKLEQYREDRDQGGDLFYWENNSADIEVENEEDEEGNDANLNSYQKFALQIKALLDEKKITHHDTAILVRTGKQADAIAAELDNLRVPNNIDSSSKLLEHKGVLLLLAVLKYKLLQDKYSLIHFLRSDVVLLTPDKLTSILEIYHHNRDATADQMLAHLKELPECRKFISLCEQKYISIAHFIREFIANYDFSIICKNEIDWKNIYTFLELIISFEMAKLPSESFDLYGFLQYCQNEQHEQSEVLQEGLQLTDSITILTIHKSKGLGFKNVFLYWNLTNYGNQNRNQKYNFIYSLNKDNYNQLTDFVIYSKNEEKDALELSSSSSLVNNETKRNLIEAIDVFYVALTRAGQKLGLFVNYKSKLGFDEYLETLKGEPALISLLIKAYKEFFIQNRGVNLSTDSLPFFHYNTPDLTTPKSAETTSADGEDREECKFYLNQFLNPYTQPEFEVNLPLQNMKQIYLEDRHQLYGNVAHEYLTYIKYGEEVEHKFARNMVLKQYGSLLPQQELKMIMEACITFIADNPEIFATKWDKIFNEKTVFSDSKEYRIDRIMVSSADKEVMIIDYKTGGIEDEEQITDYLEILKELPFVKQHNYRVKGEYVTVYLGSLRE